MSETTYSIEWPGRGELWEEGIVEDDVAREYRTACASQPGARIKDRYGIDVTDEVLERLGSDDQDDEPAMCWACRGSGEGMYDGSRCRDCGGSGVERIEEED